MNFADAVMFLQGAVGFSDLVNEQIQQTLLILERLYAASVSSFDWTIRGLFLRFLWFITAISAMTGPCEV